MSYYNSYELYHHGIKGQKWGIRRFQNRDGTYTSAGKRRRNSDDARNVESSKSGVGKKIVKGLAIGVAVGASAYAISRLNEDHVIKAKEFVRNKLSKEKVKNFVKNNSKEIGKDMAKAALSSIGAIVAAKVVSKIDTGNKDVDKVLKDTASAGINSAFKSSYNKNQNGGKSLPDNVSDAVGQPSNQGINKNSSSYQNLYKNSDGGQRDKDTRDTIHAMVNKGYDVEQIQEYLNKLDNGEIRHSTVYYSNSYELYHHGIKGQKWGIRRFRKSDGSLTAAGKRRRAENYSDDQMMRDSRVYSKGAARRINKRMLKGESVSGARSAEADRIGRSRRSAETAGHVGETVGAIGGAIAGGFLGLRISGSEKVRSLLRSAGLNDANINAISIVASGAIATGSAAVGRSLGRMGGQSIAMLAGGYSPSKYRG